VLGRQQECFWRDIDKRPNHKTTATIEQYTVVDIAVLPYAHTSARGDANPPLKDTPLPNLELCHMPQDRTTEAMSRHAQK